MPGTLSEPESRHQTFLLYDSRCGPCTSFMKMVTKLDFRKRMIPISIHGIQAKKIVQGRLSASRLKSSFHIVEVSDLDTQVYSAGDGLVRLAKYAPGGSINYAIISRVKPLRQFIRWSYFQATRVRGKSCSLADSSI